MCRDLSRRVGVVVALIFITSLTGSGGAVAQTKFAARWSGTTAGLTAGTGATIKIDVLRWSTDEEANTLVQAFKEKSDKWAEALQAAPSVGYVWTGTSSLGYSVKLARHVALPDGGDRIILAIERPLGSWDRPAWKAAGPLATDYPFSVIELHVNRRGIGDGKASLAGKLAVDDALKGPAIENYAAAPVLLRGITRTDVPAPTPTPK